MQVYSFNKNPYQTIKQIAIVFLVVYVFQGTVNAQSASTKVFSKYNYYTTEDSITIVAKIADNKNFNDYKLALFSSKNEKLKTAKFISPKLYLNLPLDKYVSRENVFFTHLFEKDKLVKKDTVRIQRLEPKNNEVKIDLERGGLITNGRPFFPFGFYCGPVKKLPEHEVVKGFNLIGPYQSNLPEGLKERKEYMDRCAQLGIKVQYSVNSLIGSGHNGAKGLDKTEEEKFEILKNEILTFKDHPALLSWYINDEPDGQGRPPKLMEKAYNFIHELDPYHPISIVFMLPSKVSAFRNSMDIAMTDPYPIPKSVNAVEEYVKQIHQTFKYEKSVWLVPQAFGGQEMWPREPTAKEIRVMTYLGLIHGARGIQYFIRTADNLKPQSISLWAECSKMAVELKDMAPFLLSDDKSEMLETNHPEIQARYFTYQDETLVIVINKSNTPEHFTVNLNSGIPFSESVDVCFENRKVSIKNRTLEDMIDALGTRVYLITNLEKQQDKNNLMYNPSFEKTTTPGLADGQNFSYSFPKKADPGATIFTDFSESFDGKYSLRFITPNDSSGKRVNFIPIILNKGRTYKASIWGKCASNSASPGFKLTINAVKQEKVFSLTNQWKNYSFLFKSDTTTTNAIVQIEMLDKGTAWFDLIEIKEDPIISYTIYENKKATISITSGLDEAIIKYSINNAHFKLYKKPFDVVSASDIKVILLEKKDTIAENEIFVPINKAIGKETVFKTIYSENYKAQGNQSLTNGIMGTTSFKDGNWLGFLDSIVEFTIELKNETEINNVTLNLLCDPNSGIFLPREISVFTSETGNNFQLSGERKINLISKRGEPYIVPLKIECDKTETRYIRVRIKTFGEIPEGYLFKGTNSWMFTDEIIVQ